MDLYGALARRKSRASHGGGVFVGNAVRDVGWGDAQAEPQSQPAVGGLEAAEISGLLVDRERRGFDAGRHAGYEAGYRDALKRAANELVGEIVYVLEIVATELVAVGDRADAAEKAAQAAMELLPGKGARLTAAAKEQSTIARGDALRSAEKVAELRMSVAGLISQVRENGVPS